MNRTLITGSETPLGTLFSAAFNELGHQTIMLETGAFDISDYYKTRDLIWNEKPDIIVNCISADDFERAEEDWQWAFALNSLGPKNLAMAAKKTDSTLVHFSSSEIFDGEAATPYTIATNPRPLNNLGSSRLSGEEMLAENGEKFFLIRTGVMFGDYPGAFPLKVLELSLTQDELEFDERRVFSITEAEELVDAVMDLLRTKRHGLYHVANQGRTTELQWAMSVLEASGFRGLAKAAPPSSARRPLMSAIDTFPLATTIGRELTGWQEATLRTIREFL